MDRNQLTMKELKMDIPVDYSNKVRLVTWEPEASMLDVLAA